MKLKMLSNIISNLWLDDNVDEIRVQLRLDVMTNEVVLPCRNLVINGEDERQTYMPVPNALTRLQTDRAKVIHSALTAAH